MEKTKPKPAVEKADPKWVIKFITFEHTLNDEMPLSRAHNLISELIRPSCEFHKLIAYFPERKLATVKLIRRASIGKASASKETQVQAEANPHADQGIVKQFIEELASVKKELVATQQANVIMRRLIDDLEKKVAEHAAAAEKAAATAQDLVLAKEQVETLSRELEIQKTIVNKAKRLERINPKKVDLQIKLADLTSAHTELLQKALALSQENTTLAQEKATLAQEKAEVALKMVLVEEQNAKLKEEVSTTMTCAYKLARCISTLTLRSEMDRFVKTYIKQHELRMKPGTKCHFVDNRGNEIPPDYARASVVLNHIKTGSVLNGELLTLTAKMNLMYHTLSAQLHSHSYNQLLVTTQDDLGIAQSLCEMYKKRPEL